MKRILTLLSIIFVYELSFAQTAIFTEDFNTSPDWTLNSAGQTIIPGSTPTPGGNPNSFVINANGQDIDLSANLHITGFGGCCGILGSPGPI